MGCDIHMYREKCIDGNWVSADKWENVYDEGTKVAREERYTARNYNLFSVLAGVRTREKTGLEQVPRGLPINASPEVTEAFASWEEDAHTPSHLYLHELKELQRVLSEKTIPVSGMKNKDELAQLRDSIASGAPDWQLLYPYCQGTNDPEQVEFLIDAPASFMIGDGLNEIVSMFDGVAGENHRVVFWFDN